MLPKKQSLDSQCETSNFHLLEEISGGSRAIYLYEAGEVAPPPNSVYSPVS